MNIESKQDVLDILNMPEDRFYAEIAPFARELCIKNLGNKIYVTAMMGYTNICKNNCLYCGMRAGNAKIMRFRKMPEEVIPTCLKAADAGYGRIFLVTGDDPKYGFNNILKIVESLSARGMHITFAVGELEKSQYAELKAAGAKAAVVKYEMSHADSFNRLNPSTTFEKRLQAIEDIKSVGLQLGSGNIIDWPGQTLDELADDIMLMKNLGISWAPIIPYMPALNTPLALEGKRGELPKLYKEIAIVRIMMPEIHITAQQPGPDLRKGLADPEANAAAAKCGADMLFMDLLTDEYAQNFRVVDDRNITGPAHVFKVCELTGRELDTGSGYVNR